MAPSAAETQGFVRASKHPKSTKYGRQNPIAERWNSDEQLLIWREKWADVNNKYLLQYPWIDARIDHRSHSARGLDEQPTIHEGVPARALEKKGIISDRCELNRQIKADNALLRELKSAVRKLMDAVKNTIPTLAETMEKLRENMIIFRYQLNHIAKGKHSMKKYIKSVTPELESYTGLVHQIKDKTKERKNLLNPDIPIVEIDSVEGRKGGKVLLTVFFRNSNLMLAFLRDRNTARSVTEVFEWLYETLGHEQYCRLFPIILTDRGSEFTDPVSIECTELGEVRSRVFYCDPQRSDQKGGCEVTHEFIRRILPKGTSFDHLQQSDILLMMSHINSYTRKKLNNQSAHRLFSFLYGDSVLPSLGIREIPANDINLTPRLLKK